MKPAINIQEKIGKTVGTRVAPDPLDVRHSRKADAIAWQKAFGFGIPKGVYRFRTHEEADQWLWKMIARHRNH